MTSNLRFEGGATCATLQVKTSPQARVMRLKVDPRTGSVVLTVPRRASQRKALDWAAGQREWIETQLAQVTPAAILVPGAALPLYGIDHVIDWDPARSRLVRVADRALLTGGPADTLEPRLLRWLRRHALDLLGRETQEYAAKAKVTVERVGIGDPMSRWGSCSASGTIRYSWRLILAPDWVRRATVAHEVAHRVHMNHGADFHRLVATLFEADPKAANLWLRQHGLSLHRVGRAG